MLWNNKNYDGMMGESSCGCNRCGCNPCMCNQCSCCDPCPCVIQCPTDPVYERPIQKIAQKDIFHEVHHIVPINTKIINNHIFKHVYDPQYSCCEEDVVTNIEDPCACNCGCNSCGSKYM